MVFFLLEYLFKVLTKKLFLCPENYDEGYFDFRCVPGGKPPVSPDGRPLEWLLVLYFVE